MNDPKRLVDEGDLGATLLASAHADGPSQRSRERAAAALGFAVGAAALTSGSVASGATGAAAAGTAMTGGAAKVAASGIWLKVIIGTVVTVAVAGGSVVAVQKASSSSSSSSSSSLSSTNNTASVTPSRSTAVATGEPTSVTSTDPPPVVVAEPAPAVDVSPGAGAPAPVVTGKTAAARAARSDTKMQPSGEPSESALARELRAVDAAKSALDRGNPNGALAALDEYDRTFPRGSLRMEANVVRVEALLARGDKPAARKLARDLLARDPSGPQARRLQSIADSP